MCRLCVARRTVWQGPTCYNPSRSTLRTKQHPPRYRRRRTVLRFPLETRWHLCKYEARPAREVFNRTNVNHSRATTQCGGVLHSTLKELAGEQSARLEHKRRRIEKPPEYGKAIGPTIERKMRLVVFYLVR